MAETDERDSGETPRRASVWSVSEGLLTAYFLLFTIQFIGGVSLVVWYDTVVVTHDSPIETLMNILWRAGVVPILSASTSYIFAEGGRLTMVISNWVEKKLAEREKRREQELIARVRAETETRVRAETEDRVRAETEARVRPEAFAEGRAYERKRIADEANGDGSAEGRNG